MTKTEIDTKIADLKKRSQNKSLPASAVKALEKMIADLEKQEPEKEERQPDMMNAYEDSVIDYIEKLGVTGDVKSIVSDHKNMVKAGYSSDKPAKETARAIYGVVTAKAKVTPKLGVKKATPAKKTKKDFSKTVKESFVEFEGKVFEAMEDEGEMTRSDAQGVAEAHSDFIGRQFDMGTTPLATAKAVLKKALVKEPDAKKEKDSKKNDLEHYKNILKNIEKYPKYNKKNVEKVIAELESALKAEPAKKAPATASKEDDCVEIIKEQKQKSKRAAELAKKSAHTPVVKKDEKRVESVVKSIVKHYKEGDLTKAAIEKLIKEFTEKLEELKELLKKAK